MYYEKKNYCSACEFEKLIVYLIQQFEIRYRLPLYIKDKGRDSKLNPKRLNVGDSVSMGFFI